MYHMKLALQHNSILVLPNIDWSHIAQTTIEDENKDLHKYQRLSLNLSLF